MIIKKIFNNNAILAKDKDKHEFVVMGCGIAFKRNVGDKVEESLIEKTFILKQKTHQKNSMEQQHLLYIV